MMRHFLAIMDYEKSEILEIMSIAAKIKSDMKNNLQTPKIGGVLAMIFEKSSTRTRASFEIGATQLGMHPMFLSSKDIQLGRGEPMKDTARVIGRMADMVMIRTHEHSRLEEFAFYSKVPVINGLSDSSHPMQLLADYFTLLELGYDEKAVIAWIGDGNNVAASYLMLAAKLGMELRVAAPKGYEISGNLTGIALNFAKKSGAKLTFTHDPKEAASGADIISTDVWTSMGQEEEAQKRLRDFAGFRVDEELFSLADPNARLLHCLPAHRGEEVSEEIFEKHAESVFLEAENRLHAQKGVMVWLNDHRGKK